MPPPQLYDFTSPEEAPRAVAFHPTQPTFFCGFSSGAVRSFSLESAKALVEHRWVPRQACPTDTHVDARPLLPLDTWRLTPFRVVQVSPRSHHRPGHQP